MTADLQYYLIHFFQDAMKVQNIEFREIDVDHLGSDKEYQIPNKNNTSSTNKSDKNDTGGKSSKS